VVLQKPYAIQHLALSERWSQSVLALASQGASGRDLDVKGAFVDVYKESRREVEDKEEVNNR